MKKSLTLALIVSILFWLHLSAPNAHGEDQDPGKEKLIRLATEAARRVRVDVDNCYVHISEEDGLIAVSFQKKDPPGHLSTGGGAKLLYRKTEDGRYEFVRGELFQ